MCVILPLVSSSPSFGIEQVTLSNTTNNTINNSKQVASPRYFRKRSISTQNSFEIIPILNSNNWFGYNSYAGYSDQQQGIFVYSLDIRDGKTEKIYKVDKPIYDIDIQNEKLIISQYEQITCFDINTKEELWRYSDEKLGDTFSCVLGNGQLLVGYPYGVLLFDIVSGRILKEK